MSPIRTARSVEHPRRNFEPAIRPRIAQCAAENNAIRFVDHLVDRNLHPEPWMPGINKHSENGPVGVLELRSTTADVYTPLAAISAQRSSRINTPRRRSKLPLDTVHPQGRTPIRGPFCAPIDKLFVASNLLSNLAAEQECSVPGKIWQMTTRGTLQSNSVMNTKRVTVRSAELGRKDDHPIIAK